MTRDPLNATGRSPGPDLSPPIALVVDWGGVLTEESMVGLVRRAKAAGIRTALLSNSQSNEYPRDGWDLLFDAVVMSGEVGMRKPEHRIYHHVLAVLDVEPRQAVMVDDLQPNVAAAVEVGMVGVLHHHYERTLEELEAVFGLPLAHWATPVSRNGETRI